MRLIDPKELRAALIEWRDNDPYKKKRFLVERWVRKVGINALIRFVSVFSTIEAEPVQHGRWVSDEVDVLFHCSVCETQISTSWDYDCDEMWNYCPNCGAKMDGDSHD